ncbi:type II secretion system F family protein [Gracilibacillus thailandensis]|mgnify:CR=1 FL=1|uniref:Flagellar assembly protein FlaJ n=1 Tax=Gracilibacillus thailandensis TaxID=563735 RepID=A0A6N7QZM0_9BACI|nr:flagellar assembly protein FlaJ [Gracilibacillus thailandensis]MRI66170.1 flagellar assembly protein FlaJ [Gracilibacillus thailandensis]
MEFLLERNRQLYYSHFHIDEKKFFNKRLMMALAFFLIYAVIIFRTGNVWLIAGVPIVMFIGFKIPYLELVSKKNQHDIIIQYEFPTFLRYFISLLSTQGNVYQTLKATIPYIHEPMKSKLEKLVEDLDRQNINNREAFLEFAESIGSSEAFMIMEMIFEFHEEGINKEDVQELENTINNLQQNKINELIEYKVNQMGKHANPILVYGLIFIFLFTGITMIAYLSQLNL